ncbi:MAG: S-formylglutathione hydrolase [Rickettsiales bacterium]
MRVVSSHICFGGRLSYVVHRSEETACDMRFTIFIPSRAKKGGKLPTLFYLSGLTCTEENFTVKAGAYRRAEELGLIVVAPDTSPRGDGIPDEDRDDIGTGAGFYIDATEEPWNKHYRMESYVTGDLRDVAAQNFPVDLGRVGIFGHSMGGHGALTLALKHPRLYRSVSAFAPICAPTKCAWGEKIFPAYLGSARAGEKHDACRLIESGFRFADGARLLVDQGTDDPFLSKGNLMPNELERVCRAAGIDLALNMREGYDHGYFFVQSFMDSHLRLHAEILGAATE